MSKATSILDGQLLLFGEQSEAWRNDHVEAMACLDLEEVVAFGNFIYERIRNIDAEWSAETLKAGTEPPEADALAIESLYNKWRDRAQQNLARATEFEQAGHVVRGMDQFRTAFDEVQGILSVSVARLRRSAQNVREGRTRPWGEVRDELLRRFGP